MKKLIYFILMLASSAGILKAMPDPHDSLIFDGENKISESLLSKTDDDCEVRVIYVSGKPEGVIKKRTIFQACGEPDTVTVYENGVLERNTIVKEGEFIITGPTSTAMIQIPDGSVIFVNKNSKFQLTKDLCKEIQATRSFLNIGSIWVKIKKAIGGGKFEVSTERACACVRGTEFTLEVKEEDGKKVDVLKVYESTVDFENIKPDYSAMQDNVDVMQKAAEDYQNGKITAEEFAKIAEDYGKMMNKESENMNKLKIEVNAGMMSTLKDGKITDPVPFDPNEDRWFDVNTDN